MHRSEPGPRPQSPLTPVIRSLEGASALDPLVHAARPLMRAVTASPAVRDALRGVCDALRGVCGGHALHPILVQVPLGTWMSALLLDATGADDEGRGAQLLTAVGTLAAVPAVATGWAELAGTGRREQRIGVVHAGANAAGVALEAASLLVRRSGRRGLALGLSLGGMSVLGIGGYLGGHLTVVRGVGSRDAAYDAED